MASIPTKETLLYKKKSAWTSSTPPTPRVQGGDKNNEKDCMGGAVAGERTPGSEPMRGRRRGRLNEWRTLRLGWWAANRSLEVAGA